VARGETAGARRPLTARGAHAGWSDERLVRACLEGNEGAWAALIDKYKGLIYSIPLKYGARPEDAADIFQSVCVELYSNLPRLRNAAALRGWLATVTAHQTLHSSRKQRKRADREATLDEEADATPGVLPPDLMEQVEREQMVRDATARLSPRCQEMIRLLFYTDPPLPYREVASRLGLAIGSIGFIRGRCLQRLEKTLHEMGF
jgi:RNA polymerase sigma factor (sigma-70 family)